MKGDEMKKLKNLMVMLMGIIVLSSLVGCNTTKGAGEDIEQTGKNIRETVDKNQ
jgi:predicted small secreted protein